MQTKKLRLSLEGIYFSSLLKQYKLIVNVFFFCKCFFSPPYEEEEERGEQRNATKLFFVQQPYYVVFMLLPFCLESNIIVYKLTVFQVI